MGRIGMGREIKFRAWLKNESRMINPVIQLSVKAQYSTIAWYEDMHDALSGTLSDAFLDQVELMQYTGLKDKNGKEIYEGDLVKGKTDIFERLVGSIEYAGCAYVVDGVGKYIKIREELNRSYEIIGNIYENPELLEVVKSGR